MRVAEVFDGRGPNGGVLIKRPAVAESEIDALARYLTSAPVALATANTGQDEMSPGAGMAVPRAYHTDGYWIWPAAVGYYLHHYRLPPQPDLVAHIRARGFEVGPVPEPVRQAAAAQMLEELAAARGRKRRPVPQQPAEPASEPAAAPMPGQPDQADQPSRADHPAEPESAPAPWLPEPPADERRETAEPAQSAQPALEAAEALEARQTAEAPPADALPVVSFSRELTQAGNRHAAWVLEQIEAFLSFMPEDEWSVDHDSRLYRQAGRRFAVDALGRLAKDGHWTWAWAEPAAWSADPRITERVRIVCQEGAELGIAEFAAPVLDLSANSDAEDPETAAEMLAWTVMGLAGARAYIGHSQDTGGRIYYLAFDETIPAATPALGEVPRFLSQGVLKFEESPADCVLGYLEHHGWEWSRSADGIEVSAAGLGSFTADLSGDGTLTGISLH
jgi:hypothetical protein